MDEMPSSAEASATRGELRVARAAEVVQAWGIAMTCSRPRLLALPAILSLIACNKSSPASGSSSDKGGAGSSPGENAAIPGLAFLEGFEGEIDAQYSKGDTKAEPAAAPTPLAALIKSGKFRFDVPEKLTEGPGARFFGGKAWGIFDSNAKKLSIVSDSKQQVIVVDMNKSGERFKNLSHPPPSPSGPTGNPTEPEKKITKTGRFETVAGRKCEDWDIVGDHRQGTVCVAHEGISWFSLPAAALPSEHAWALELMDGKHFPLKFVGYGKDGATEESRFEITKMDKKTIPDSAFVYPPSYQVMDLDQMIQAMTGMSGAMAAGLPGAMGSAPAAGARPGFPTGMPSNIPGLTPQQMQQIQQRMQQAQQHMQH
jgi:hypothetical protein